MSACMATKDKYYSDGRPNRLSIPRSRNYLDGEKRIISEDLVTKGGTQENAVGIEMCRIELWRTNEEVL